MSEKIVSCRPRGIPSNEMIADTIARKVFAKAHVSELELAAIINAALESRDAMSLALEGAQS